MSDETTETPESPDHVARLEAIKEEVDELAEEVRSLDDITDEQAAQLAEGQPVEMTMPFTQLTVPPGVNVNVMKQENGDRVIVIGPMAMHVVLPFSEDGARSFARDLTGGIEIASGLPAKIELVK